jgi:polyhydroxyalkanoate synthase subunit PhaE
VSDRTKTGEVDPVGGWSNLWASMAELSNSVMESWSGSKAPFMISRLSEKATGQVNDLSAAIERMAQGPQLADVWDFDRKLALAFGAWLDMRARLASYNAVASAPWSEASRRFLEVMSQNRAESAKLHGWREVFTKWAARSTKRGRSYAFTA